MNILLVSTQFPPRLGGVATASHRIAQGLSKKGHNVYVITRLKIGQEQPNSCDPISWNDGQVKVFGFGQSNMNKPHYGFSLVRMAEICRNLEIDIIHAYYLNPAGYMAVALAGQLSVPCVVALRGDDITYSLCVRPNEVKKILEASTIITTVSQSLGEWARMIKPELEYYTIENSVSRTFALNKNKRNEWRKYFCLSDDEIVIGANAVFRWKKNPDLLLKIISNLSKTDLKSLIYVQIGDFEQKMEQKAREAIMTGSSNNTKRELIVCRHPTRDYLSSILNGIDLLLITSIREGMPNVMLESIACGTPVATTPVNGCFEFLSRSNMGILLDQYDEKESANKIYKLLINKTIYKRLSKNGRKEVERNHRIERELAEIEKVYSRAIALDERAL